MDLKGKRALITGASSGIGAASARRLARDGCALFLAGGANADGLAVTVDACRGAGAPVTAETFDLSSVEETARLADRALAALGAPDIIVNCAAARGRKPVSEFTIEEITRLFHVNAIAPYLICARLSPHLVARGGGRIINVGSIAADIATPGNSLYSTTKGALHAMTRALAVELGPHGVRVNGVAPGTTLSPGTSRRLAANPPMAEATRRAIPAARFGEPDEIAELIAFLVSGEADYINGAIIVIDGGRRVAWA